MRVKCNKKQFLILASEKLIFTIGISPYPDNALWNAGWRVGLQWRYWKIFCLRYER